MEKLKIEALHHLSAFPMDDIVSSCFSADNDLRQFGHEMSDSACGISAMIVEIVQFELAPGTSRAKVMELYRRSAADWVKNKDLIQKYYFYDEAACRGGGVYIWTSREAAEQGHGKDYHDMVLRTYGSVPRIEVLDALLHVDPAAGKVSELP
jgi:hypothetical protein